MALVAHVLEEFFKYSDVIIIVFSSQCLSWDAPFH